MSKVPGETIGARDQRESGASGRGCPDDPAGARLWLAAKLADGLESGPGSEMTAEEWAKLGDRAMERAAKRRRAS